MFYYYFLPIYLKTVYYGMITIIIALLITGDYGKIKKAVKIIREQTRLLINHATT